MADLGPMKVWTNRVPTALVEAWGARAGREGVTASAMLRHVMEASLAARRPIMPPATPTLPDAADCRHPKADRQPLGYGTRCGKCRKMIR